MKKNRIFGLASGLALLLAGGCSNDTFDSGKNQGQLRPSDEAGGVYMTVDFNMPSANGGTRSATIEPGVNGTASDGGTEEGSDAENYVSSALIVLASSEAKPESRIDKYGFIVAGEVPSNRIATATIDGNTNKMYRATARLQKENLNTLYGIYGDENVPEVYVFVFANPTADLINQFDGSKTPFGSSSWINETCEVIQTINASDGKNIGIWGTNSFLMNNVNLDTRDLPKNLLDWEKFSSVDNPFKLSGVNTISENNKVDNSDAVKRGNILVERSVARFDFKDGSKDAEGKPNGNRYNVLFNTKEDGDTDNEKPAVDVLIQKMCLVNMSNKFYYLPRVSPNGQLTDFSLCGKEDKWVREANGIYSGGNYVVGPYATEFGGAIENDFSKYMNFPFFEDNGSFNNEVMSSDRWDVAKVEDVLNEKNTSDNYQNKHEYKVWRYVTENVIPYNNDNQVNGISTGVVFKGKLLGSKLADEENPGYYEEAWNIGHIKNLANCLNGKPFTYNKETITLTGRSDHDPILYYYQGHLYLGWRHIRQAAIQASVTINSSGAMEINRSNSLYKAVFGDGPIPTYTQDGKEHNMVYVDPQDATKSTVIDDPMWKAAKDNPNSEEFLAYLQSANYAWSQWALNGKEVGDDATGASSQNKKELNAMRAAVTGAGITIFQSSIDSDYGAGYYCYYYYWNRHNDNGLNGSMGPMEFCVVRNNVYKLSIDKISRLGHPRIPENDPNNPTPDTPDEIDEIYLSVRMEIVPWSVRVNKIEF